MKFGSVCSGIEAASVAWKPLGWKAAWLAEIEPFPSAVLAHHYPDTPNFGDMTKFKDWPTDDKHSIDLLCGGTPCQSFSVAGLRKGLDDPRGNLMLTFGAIADKYRPTWLVWENVPGVLSSNGGRDFGAFLGMLGQLGYGFAYRVLDAQYFGVAQRRRRVFVVGYLGDWRRAAAVLFERHSLQGHSAPRRKTRQGIAGGIEIGPGGGRYTDLNPTLDARAKDGPIRNQLASAVITMAHGQGGAEVATERIPTLTCNHEAPIAAYTTKLHNTTSNHAGKFYEEYSTSLDRSSPPPAVICQIVAHSLRGEGFDASEDGAGRGTPLVPVVAPTLDQRAGRSGANSFATSGGLIPVCHVDTMPTLRAGAPNGGAGHGARSGDSKDGYIVPIAIQDVRPIEKAQNGRGWNDDGTAYTVDTHATQGVAQPIAFHPAQDPISSTDGTTHGLGCGSSGGQASVAVAQPLTFNMHKSSNEASSLGISQDRTDCLRACEKSPFAVLPSQAMAVRRLTPVECERLQGFPDNYTAIPWHKKPASDCPDGPRYKALGNSWAVPVARWIGRRIDLAVKASA